MPLLLFRSREQSNDLITKRYHVPPEFFGGPLDVGYYIGSSVAGGGGRAAARDTPELAEAPPVATNVLEKEAVSFQTASGVGYWRWCHEPDEPVQGTATTRQTLTERSPTCRPSGCQDNVAKHGCLVSGRRKRNFLAA